MIVLRSSKSEAPIHIDAETPLMCVKHGEYHPMRRSCRDAYRSWSKHYSHLPAAEFQAAYHAAVELQMLNRWLWEREL